ncbi:MAG: CPBP family intramembrane metalloprotease [Opitutales bacterium]|nr:CPBP family intramembrane metalloprotease [Opitutales bacterium]
MDADPFSTDSVPPALAVYAAILFFAGLGALVSFLIWNFTRRDKPFPGVSVWHIRLPDFLTFIFALLLCVIAVGLFLHAFTPRGEDGERTDPSAGMAILSGFLMQGGFLAVFIVFRAQFSDWRERPLSLEPKPLLTAGQLGIFALLAAWPVVTLFSAAWLFLISWLRGLGLDIELAPQAPVEMFQEAENVLHIVGLSILAVVMAPVAEEYVFRAGIFRYLRGHMALPAAAVLNGLLFGLIHFNIQSFLPLAVLGALLCLSYEWTGDIKVPIFFHAAFNLNSVVMIYMQT